MAQTPHAVQWGTITLHLDNKAFRKGFLAARRWYFADIYGERGRKPEEPQHAVALTSEDVLRFIAVPDDQGRYHLGEEACERYRWIPGLSGRLPGRAACPR